MSAKNGSISYWQKPMMDRLVVCAFKIWGFIVRNLYFLFSLGSFPSSISSFLLPVHHILESSVKSGPEGARVTTTTGEIRGSNFTGANGKLDTTPLLQNVVLFCSKQMKGQEQSKAPVYHPTTSCTTLLSSTKHIIFLLPLISFQHLQ
jgi:hypothetical protein